MAPNTKTAPTQVLELSTDTPDRETIRIDGEAYQLATMSDLTLGDQLRVARSMPLFQKIATATGVESLTDEQIDQIDADVRWTVRKLVLEAPDEVLDKLRDEQLLAIISCFKGAGTAARKTTPRQKRSRDS